MRDARTAAVLTTLALALASLLSACSNNDDQAAQNISDFLVKSAKSPDLASPLLSVKRKDADCIGKGLVAKIGTDQLQAYGLLDKDNKVKGNVTQLKMSAGDAKAATGVLFGCADVKAMMRRATVASGLLPKAMRPCLNDVITDDNLRGMFVSLFQGNQDAANKSLVQPMTKCALGSKGQ